MKAINVPRPGRKGRQALTLLLLLMLSDWLVGAELQSHRVFAVWLAGLSGRPDLLRVLDQVLSVVELILAAWYLPVILAALTAIFWLWDIRRLLLLPLIAFTAW